LPHFRRMEATYGNIHRLVVYSLLGMFLWRRRLTSRSVKEIVHIAKLIMRPMLTFPQAPSPTITSFRLISDILSKVVRDTLGELDSRSRRGFSRDVGRAPSTYDSVQFKAQLQFRCSTVNSNCGLCVRICNTAPQHRFQGKDRPLRMSQFKCCCVLQFEQPRRELQVLTLLGLP